MPKTTVSRWAVLAAVLAVLVLLAAMLSGLGHRWGLWHFATGFRILRYAVYAAIAVIPISLIALVRTRPGLHRRGLTVSILSLVVGLVVVGNTYRLMKRARSVPPIHDITTDTEDPPEFVAIAPLRADAPNSTEYDGEKTASQQRAAYPDIQTIRVDLDRDAAFEKALNAAETMGWTIVDADAQEGRIEATAETFWYGFKDDVVIRVRPSNGGSIIDIRSTSRVGGSDVGTNAARIRKYRGRVTG